MGDINADIGIRIQRMAGAMCCAVLFLADGTYSVTAEVGFSVKYFQFGFIDLGKQTPHRTLNQESIRNMMLEGAQTLKHPPRHFPKLSEFLF
jgi:hypothetical protein